VKVASRWPHGPDFADPPDWVFAGRFVARECWAAMIGRGIVALKIRASLDVKKSNGAGGI
jgi:hypothetical protein